MKSRNGLLSRFLSAFSGRSRSSLKEQELKMMIGAICGTRDDELDCDECQEQLDEFAEQVLAGKKPEEAIPLVHAHLQMCMECREEFEALLRALKAHTKTKRSR